MDGALVSTDVAGYRIEEVAGQGGMGVVYRATDLELDRTVALKVVAPGLASDAGFRRRFITESKVAASIDHPNVIPIYQAGERDGVLFLAMRFVPGPDLGATLKQEGSLDPARAARITAQVASALQSAHERGLVHRDIKPANVLLGGDDHVYLTDFGLSKRVTSDDTRSLPQGLRGTLDYVSPEQIRGGEMTYAADIYSLGCLLFQLVAGRVPFPLETDEAKLWAHLSEPPPELSGSPTVVALNEVVTKAMSKRPEDRYGSARAMGEATTEAAAKAVDDARGSRPKRRPRLSGRPEREHRRALIVDALTHPMNVVLLAALLVVGFVLQRSAVLIPIAVVAYAIAVFLTYRHPRTQERVLARELGRDTRTGA